MSFSPMMTQYLEMKEKCKDCLLFFRLGDFYEMFFDDAITASRELEITLTHRLAGGNTKAPMCGVPFHSAESYISRLIEKGYKVAICEQLTEPTKGKTLVERGIVRVVTPGTIIEDSLLNREKNNYLCCFFALQNSIAAAWTDISTGKLEYSSCDSLIEVNELLSRLEPSEILCNAEMQLKSINLSTVKYGAVCPFSIFEESAFEAANARKAITEQLGADFLQSLKGKEQCVPPIGALLLYLKQTQMRELPHLSPQFSDESAAMSMDFNTRRNLELFVSIADGKKRGSLLWVLDKTRTAIGARTLRGWLESPLLCENGINARLDGVEELTADRNFKLDKLSDILSDFRDIERICGRLSLGGISPKECYALGASLKKTAELKGVLSELKSPIFADIFAQITDHSKLFSLILSAIRSDLDSGTSKDGGEKAVFSAEAERQDGGEFICRGFDKQLDEFLDFKLNFESLIKKIETGEREETGIKNLKIGFNRIIGYYIEVTKSNLGLVPYRYIRKGSTLGSERYITEELKELEIEVLGADENARRRENEIYDAILKSIKAELEQILTSARAVGGLDCLLSFASVSIENGYVRPKIVGDGRIKITEGRHPVVERLTRDTFVPNDTVLDDDESKIMLITGPNMAGKSVYMRQVALIAIMAQTGCFVPALSAELCITDRIFTRIGASDDLKSGRSTFMVEMNEVSVILAGATDRSLVLLDEVGRGTSTYDGLSIAWAILEQLSQKFKSKVLFSTHYHELTDLEGRLVGVKNYKLTVRDVGGTIAFVRKLLRGSANRSFGIEVASLAGLPDEVILRAKELLKKLTAEGLSKSARMSEQAGQVSMFEPSKQNEIFSILAEIDLDSVTPRHALDILSDLKDKLKDQA